jgi:hypothetical protein
VSSLVFTLDHELFGDGSGDIHRCMVEPLERLRPVLQRAGVRPVLFVDTACMVMLQRRGSRTERRAVQRVATQLREVVAAGGEAALHLHPQWDGAVPSPSGWSLHASHRLAEHPLSTVRRMVAEGTSWLADATGCLPLSFRAGGLCMRPSGGILSVLGEAGYRVDSSVVPGLFGDRPDEGYDHRSAPRTGFWPVSTDVTKRGAGPLLEVPIATGVTGMVRDLAWQLKLARERGRRSGRGHRGRLGAAMTRLRRRGRVALDTTGQPTRTLSAITAQRLSVAPDGPVVSIGHTKDLGARELAQIEAYLDWTARQPALSSTTFRGWLRDQAP